MEAILGVRGLPEEEEVCYPESDGKPMAETDNHRDLMVGMIEALKAFFMDEPMVYVSGNLFVYFGQGDPSACVAPDVFVVKGVIKKKRRTYKIWEEGKGPELVIELTSKKTAFEDLKTKRQIYQEELQVEEYFLYDPLREYLKPPLQGYRRVRERYQAIRRVKGRLRSRVLGLELGVEESELRLYDPRSGERLPIPMEQAEARRQAEEKAQREAEARRQAEAELARLRAELEALKKRQTAP